MQPHHNRRLFDLAQRNAQRLALERFCATTSSSLPALCEQQSQAIFHPDTPDVIRLAYARNAGIHQLDLPIGSAPPRSLRTTSYKRACAWVEAEVKRLIDDDYLVSLGGADQLTFDSVSLWIPSLPVLRLGHKDLLRSIVNLLTLELRQLALVRDSDGTALVLDSYVGNLLHEPSEVGVVYELSHTASDA